MPSVAPFFLLIQSTASFVSAAGSAHGVLRGRKSVVANDAESLTSALFMWAV